MILLRVLLACCLMQDWIDRFFVYIHYVICKMRSKNARKMVLNVYMSLYLLNQYMCLLFQDGTAINVNVTLFKD